MYEKKNKRMLGLGGGLTVAVVELRRARHYWRHSLTAVGGGVDVAWTGGTLMSEFQTVIDFLFNMEQGIFYS